jgi:hypothetical protein
MASSVNKNVIGIFACCETCETNVEESRTFSGTYGTHGFGLKIWKKKDCMEDLGIDGNVSRINSMGWHGLDSFGLGFGPVVKSCEDGNEPLGIIWEISCLLQNNSAALSWLVCLL